MRLNWRLWLLLASVLLMVWAISPWPYNDGVAITSITVNGPAAQGGIEGPRATEQPMLRERIVSVNSIETATMEQYQSALTSVMPGVITQVRTNRESYVLPVPHENESFDPENPLGIRVQDAPTSNIRQGLDLTGGIRVLVQPEEPVEESTMELVLSNIEKRLNVFGLSDVIVRQTNDFSGNQFILVEIAGANEEAIIDLITSQGRFEAQVGNITVFTGGDDVTHVGRSATDSGIQRCSPIEGQGYACEFFFSISLSAEAAQRQADATRNLQVVTQGGQSYLTEQLHLFLDGENISSLNIASSLRGRAETQIQISGSEVGATQIAAAEAAEQEMKQLQTVLATGSLPVQLQVVKADAISPVLGSTFIQNIWLVGLVALIAVILVVTIRYRDWRIAIPMVVTMMSEVIMILGVASLIKWNLDLAAIAGILVAVGTGVDDQIVIVDEIKSGRSSGTWKQRMAKAFFIIFAAFFTLVAAMAPLFLAGAGLVRGFAFTTILGVTVGVLITRPAFAAIAEKVVKQK